MLERWSRPDRHERDRPGLHGGGKTGTAQIPRRKDSYVTGAYMASFVGFAPANNPVLSSSSC